VTDKEIQDKILAIWKKMDIAQPPAFCDGSALIPIKGEPADDPHMVAGGSVECPGCAACRNEAPAEAVKKHCGGRGLVVGCPVCGKKWGA